jgi:hypothetical protein
MNFFDLIDDVKSIITKHLSSAPTHPTHINTQHRFAVLVRRGEDYLGDEFAQRHGHVQALCSKDYVVKSV